MTVENQTWHQMPDLIVARECHASCSLGNSSVYVFFGFDSQGHCLSSIERLDLADQGSISDCSWTLLSNIQMEGRAFPAVCALSSTEIVIMGGRDQFGYLGDVFILDTKAGMSTQVAKDSD